MDVESLAASSGARCRPAEIEREAEERPYNLNKSRAMAKKLSATELAEFTVTNTDGGVKFTFNAGMYELFKQAANEFYTSGEMKSKCTPKDGIDKSRSVVVDTRYKVMVGKTHYTFNMYHTTCTCLVNGKATMQFIQHDIDDIFSLVNARLLREGCTIDQFNQHVRNMIQEYCTQVSDRDNDKMDSSVDDEVILCLGNSRDDRPTIDQTTVSKYVETCDVPGTITNNIRDDVTISCDNHQDRSRNTQGSPRCPPDMYKLLLNLNVAIDDLNKKAENHDSHLLLMLDKIDRLEKRADDQERQLSILRDELVSIKKHCSVNILSTKSHVTDSTDGLSATVKEEVSKMSVSIHKRLQSIFDSLKQIHDNSHKGTTVEETTPKTIIDLDMEDDTDTVPTRSHNTLVKRPIVKNKTQSVSKRSLIIGDSILKGVSKRGLNPNVDVLSHSGADIDTISKRCKELDLVQYDHVILYIGGNNVARGQSVTSLYKELKSLVSLLKNSGCCVSICTVVPRYDTDITAYNDVISQLCDELNISIIQVYSTFIFGDGSTVNQYFLRDLIHLSPQGTRTLLHTINKSVTIMTKQNHRYSSYGSQYKHSYRFNGTGHSYGNSGRDGRRAGGYGDYVRYRQ